MTGLEAVLMTIIAAATPLLLAAIGELVAERSGVLNLGVEGMMIMGAIGGFAVAWVSGSALLGIIAAVGAGVGLSLVFAFLTQTLVSNQVATGLALTLFGLGLSGLIGEAFTGLPGVKLHPIHVPGLSDLPLVGPVDLRPGRDSSTRPSRSPPSSRGCSPAPGLGLVIRATGGNHHSAHALGYNVIAVRYGCIAFGGATAGLAGGYLSLVYTPQWIENMTAGRGWIALALVVFSTWAPRRVAVGAYLFGTVWIMGLYVQGIGINIAPQFLASLPYLITIAALVLISGDRLLTKVNTPACLGQPFVPDR